LTSHPLAGSPATSGRAEDGRTKPVVAILGTGGTIANTADGHVSIAEVLAGVAAHHPDLPEEVRLEAVDLFRIGADKVTPAHWLEVQAAVEQQAARDDVVGVVVTHGTYTVEETAYFLHLALRTPKPVVLTCAQIKFDLLGSDGPRNLRDAIRVARSPLAAGRGVMLVMHDLIHSARDVTKTSQRMAGFRSGEAGPLGTIESDAVTFFRRPERRHTTHSVLVPTSPPPRVDIVASYAGADGAAVRACVSAGAKGIVVSGFSYRGWPAPGDQRQALEEAVEEGIPVVQTSRGLLGRVPAEDPRGPQFLTGDSLTPQKARILLMLALGTPGAHADLQACFDQY
jgi:L-asparaginase